MPVTFDTLKPTAKSLNNLEKIHINKTNFRKTFHSR